MFFSASKFADNRCEVTLKTLNPLTRIFYSFIKNSTSRELQFSLHTIDIFVVTFAPLSPVAFVRLMMCLCERAD